MEVFVVVETAAPVRRNHPIYMDILARVFRPVLCGWVVGGVSVFVCMSVNISMCFLVFYACAGMIVCVGMRVFVRVCI